MQEEKIKRARGIYLLPNLLTVGALFAGFFAIISATHGNFKVSAIAIFIAMLLDSLDGRIARLTNTESEFGAQMDSMSDMVCFGITPALVLYLWCLSHLGKIGWLAAFIYTVCTALRLARFNAIDDPSDKRYFRGLPTPAAAGMIASMIWVFTKFHLHGIEWKHTIAVITVCLALLKVSVIPYRSFKDFDARNKAPFLAIVILALAFAFIALDPPDVFFVLFSVFVISGPIMLVINFFRRNKTIEHSDDKQNNH